MENTIWRTFNTLLTSAGYRRALALTTFDDTVGCHETTIDDVLQGLVGGDQTISEREAQQLLLQRLRDAWTWTVVLKVLIVLHQLAVCCLTTPQWLDSFFRDSNVLEMIQSFREGEGTDAQAEAHSFVIRQYATYVATVVSELQTHGTPASLYIKRAGRGNIGRRLENEAFAAVEDEELLCEIMAIRRLLDSCLSCFVQQEQELPLVGKCSLTSCAASVLLRDALMLHSALFEALKEIRERYSKLHPNDIQITQDIYVLCQKSNENLRSFLFMLKGLPRFSSVLLPERLDEIPHLPKRCENQQQLLPNFTPERCCNSVEDVPYLNRNFLTIDVDKNDVKELEQQSEAKAHENTIHWDCVPLEKRSKSNVCETDGANQEGDTGEIVVAAETEQEPRGVSQHPSLEQQSSNISAIPLPPYPHPTHLAATASYSFLLEKEKKSARVQRSDEEKKVLNVFNVSKAADMLSLSSEKSSPFSTVGFSIENDAVDLLSLP